jgi:hypothetical protein
MYENWRCPLCEQRLLPTHVGRYESLDEHVSNPNGTPSAKPGMQCTNKHCLSYELGCVWSAEGEVYLDYNKLTLFRQATKQTAALGSFSYHYDGGKAARDKIKRRWDVFIPIINRKWCIEYSAPERGGEDMETRYMPHPWKRKLKIWRTYIARS